MIELEDKYIDDNILEPYQYVQAVLDRFVAINYDAALDAVRLHAKELDAGHIRQQIVDFIRNNPPLKTVPLYFRDGRANYLWYSDFYDDAGKEVFGKQYRMFETPVIAITPASYAIELAKIDLPYFRELVNLVSLVRLEQEAERIERKKATVAQVVELVEEAKPAQEPEPPQPEPPLPTENPPPSNPTNPNLRPNNTRFWRNALSVSNFFVAR